MSNNIEIHKKKDISELTGSVAGGKYTLFRIIGRGGLTMVYMGIYEEKHTVVSVKVYDLPHIGAEWTKELKSNLDILHRIEHPALPNVIEYFEEQGFLFVISPYVEGLDLMKIAEAGGGKITFSEGKIVDYALQAADALSYLHTFDPPLVHGDVKPENLMLDGEGYIHLVDYSVTRQYRPNAPAGPKVGTSGYAPPEQCEGLTEPRSDIYALGATMFFLATGVLPRDISRSIKNIQIINTGISKNLEQIIIKCMQLKPGKRYPSAKALAQDLMKLKRSSRPARLSSPRMETVYAAPPGMDIVYASPRMMESRGNVFAGDRQDTMWGRQNTTMRLRIKTAVLSEAPGPNTELRPEVIEENLLPITGYPLNHAVSSEDDDIKTV